MWTWLERPDNSLRLVQLGAGMTSLKNTSPANSILEGSVTLSYIHCTPMILIFHLCFS
jgi:hypothetical protein